MLIFNREKFLILFLIAFHLMASAQTFNGAGGPIPDDGNSVDYLIEVSGLPNTIDTLNFGIETVCINATHTYNSDLEFYLIAPDGQRVGLSLSNGGDGDNYTATCFNHFATTPIGQGTPPFTGTFQPQGQLGFVNNGQNPNGIWKLHIYDNYAFADMGDLQDWSITFGNTPALAYFVTETNIPLVILKTNGQGIPGDTKITAQMGIIDNGIGAINRVTDPFNGYDGFIGIEVRGSSSAGFPQKQYSFETRDSLGNNLDISLLGMAADNDWILYAPYTDKSLMRNRLTYDLSNDMNRWAIKGRFCEVILNGEYQGIYELTENIKRGKDRLNIAKMTPSDTIGDELTGGYIVKIDRVSGPSWVSNFLPDQINVYENQIVYQCIYPKPEDILPVQFNYIQQYVDSFERALAAPTFKNPLTGWRKYADEDAFIDYFLLNELTKNVDAYTLSTFFFKDKNSNGGKLQMGPNWDYNLAWRNADYCTGDLADGWIYRKNDVCGTDISFWWKRFMLDTAYKNRMKCRWMELRTTVLDTTYIFNKMDSIAEYLGASKDRHFRQWPILGTYVWPNPAPLANTYTEELDNMKQWIVERLNWMDNNLPGICSPVSAEMVFGGNEFSIFPNPVAETLHINMAPLRPNDINITVYDGLGQVVLLQSFTTAGNDSETVTIDFKAIPKGFYFVTMSDDSGAIGVKKIVKM
jgi:CotH kinase protein/Secretion system C-terminal sorting domain/Proprotein convertase P-domain